jgi:RecA/RadA recombinase
MGDPLKDLFAKIKKKHGKMSVGIASELIDDIPRIPTGIFWLDVDTGGGIPIGRMTEVVGLKSSGKSSLMAKTVASAQRLCRKCFTPITEWGEETRKRQVTNVDMETGEVTKTTEKYQAKVALDCGNKCRATVDGKKRHPGRMVVLWVDQEGTFTPEFYTHFGVDCDDLHLSQPETGEQAVDLVDAAIRTASVDLIIVDSIAAMTPSVEREASAYDLQVGLQARTVNKGLRVWTASLNERDARGDTNCTLLLVNQFRMKIAAFYTGYTKPGGVGQEFATSIEVQLKQKEYQYDVSGNPIWELIEYFVEKNKVGRPKGGGKYRMCLMRHPAFDGVPDVWRLPGDTWDDAVVAEVAEERGVLRVSEEEGKIALFGTEFESPEALQRELFEKGELYWRARNALIQMIVNAPSDGKLKIKRKKKKKDDDE